MSYFKLIILSLLLFKLFDYHPLHASGLHDFVNTVIQSLPTIQAEAQKIKEKEWLHIQSKGIDDIQWSLDATSITAHPYSSNPFTPSYIETKSINTALNKYISKLGGTFSVYQSWTHTDQRISPSLSELSFSIPSIYHEVESGLRYTQPLLRNIFGAQSESERDTTKLGIKIQQHQSASTIESTVFQMIKEYLDWVRLSERVQLRKKQHALSQRLYKQTQRKFKNKLIETLDLLRSQRQYQASEHALMMEQSNLVAKEAQILTLLNTSTSSFTLPPFNVYTLPNPLPSPPKKTPPPRWKRIFELRKRQLQRQRIASDNARWPTLDFSVTLAQTGGGRSYSNATETQTQDPRFMLHYQQSLGNQAARARDAQLQIELKRLQNEWESERLSRDASLIQTQRLLTELTHTIQQSRSQINIARKQVHEEDALYQQGRNTLNNIIQAQNMKTEIALHHIDLLTQYHRLYFHALHASQTLLSYWGIPE